MQQQKLSQGLTLVNTSVLYAYGMYIWHYSFFIFLCEHVIIKQIYRFKNGKMLHITSLVLKKKQCKNVASDYQLRQIDFIIFLAQGNWLLVTSFLSKAFFTFELMLQNIRRNICNRQGQFHTVQTI